MNFVLINSSHSINQFDCGEEKLNDFLKNKAFLNQERRLGATTLLLDPEQVVVGFYTICSSHIERGVLPRSFGGNLPTQVPAIRLARLAIDKHHQGKRLGALLVAHALKKCYEQSVEFGGYVVIIDVKNEKAQRFYEHFGIFRIFRENPLMIGIKTKDINSHFPKTAWEPALSGIPRN